MRLFFMSLIGEGQMGIKPEDILPDAQNTATFGGVSLRKGTVAAALANAEILESRDATESEKTDARNTLKALVPALVVLGLNKHLVWKNPEIQKMMDEVLAR